MAAALRLNIAFILRSVEVISSGLDHDVILGLITFAIFDANVSYITADPALAERHGAVDQIVPDDMRRPVSVNALSASLHIPYETTRRYVNRLIELGRCVKVDRRGVIVPSSKIDSPKTLEAVAAQFGYLNRFLRDLKAIGVTAD
jgi:hypothetical protein